MTAFVLELQAAAEALGTTPMKIIQEAGLAQANYYWWKQGKCKPSPKNALKIYKAIERLSQKKVAPETIPEENPATKGEVAAQIIGLIYRCSATPDEKRAILDLFFSLA